MNILIAIDSFKGSLSSSKANGIVKKAFSRVADGSFEIIDLADGGDGTLDAFKSTLNAKVKHGSFHNSVMKKINARYLLFPSNNALIELAETAGLSLLKNIEKNPLHTTTYGVGEQFLDAVRNGASHVFIGIGGSSTNDGGMGFLDALGVEFVDVNGEVLPPTGESLSKVDALRHTEVLKQYEHMKITILCDVNNPLTGKKGAAQVYGPQKGADDEAVQTLDKGIKHYAELLNMTDDEMNIPGMGAAGGFPLSLKRFFNIELKSGFQVLSDLVNLRAHIEKADLIITGEGSIDQSTLNDKAPFKLAQLAKENALPVIAFTGAFDIEIPRHLYPFDSVFTIASKPMKPGDALNANIAEKHLFSSALEVARLIKTFL